MRGVFLDLAAYVRHVHAEYLVVLLRIGTPHAAYQVSVGKNRSGVLPQQRDQAVFILGEFNVVSVDIHAVLRVIYYQPADLKPGIPRYGEVRAAVAGVPERYPDPCEKLLRAEWFLYIIVGSVFEGAYLVLLLLAGGHNDHRHSRPFAYFLQYCYAVHIRKPEVKQYNIGAVRASEYFGIPAVFGNDNVVPLGFQNRFYVKADAAVVVNYQHLVSELHVLASGILHLFIIYSSLLYHIFLMIGIFFINKRQYNTQICAKSSNKK